MSAPAPNLDGFKNAGEHSSQSSASADDKKLSCLPQLTKKQFDEITHKYYTGGETAVLAQSVEQRTENPRVPSSILGDGIFAVFCIRQERVVLTFVTTVHVTAALFIICIVLLQGGSSGGLGAGLGGGSGGSQSMFGASGPVSFLSKMTYVFALIFMITSISLTVMQGTNYDIGLKERLQEASESKPNDNAIPAPVEKEEDAEAQQ